MVVGMVIAVKPSRAALPRAKSQRTHLLSLPVTITAGEKDVGRVSSAYNNRPKLMILSNSSKTDTYTQVNHRMSSLHK